MAMSKFQIVQMIAGSVTVPLNLKSWRQLQGPFSVHAFYYYSHDLFHPRTFSPNACMAGRHGVLQSYYLGRHELSFRLIKRPRAMLIVAYNYGYRGSVHSVSCYRFCAA